MVWIFYLALCNWIVLIFDSKALKYFVFGKQALSWGKIP